MNTHPFFSTKLILQVVFVLISSFFNHQVIAQFSFEYNTDPRVKIGNDTLDLAWSGGLNYAQASAIDYDFDGDQDLLMFDRSSDNIQLFEQITVNGQKKYQYVYNGAQFFPADIRYRVTTVDYNQDGKMDLFAYGIGGIKVYKNSGDAVNGLQWTVAKNLLYSDYWGSSMNLYVSSSDIPAIVDVEGDGDYDILTFHIGGERLQYHQNQSMELYGIPDSLVYELKNECWGKFREDLNTSTVYLNDQSPECTSGNVPGAEYPDLPESDLPIKPTEQQPKHAGSTVLAIDINNSGVLDLVLGDVAYPNMNLLINGGTNPNTNSAMISVDNSFPSNSLPINMNLFPAAFWLDVDFDGKKDLIVGANAKNISENESSVFYYKNVGTNNAPTFVYQTNRFLQNQMIEHGTGSIPFLFDADNDGLKDLFVANFYKYKPTLDKNSSVAFYKNTGTSTNPVYTLIDNDFLNLSSSENGLRMVPALGDLDGDGDQDMMLGLENGKLAYYPNTSAGASVTFGTPITNYADNTGTPISAGQYAFPQLFDLNKDGLLDLIVGRKTGEIMYYQNIGTSTIPSFQLVNPQLGMIDVATTSPDGYTSPHFFRWQDTTFLFLGAADGTLHYYKDIDTNLNSGSSFELVSANFLGLNCGAYSSFWVDDIDNDGFLNLFAGHDLGGLLHFEVDPNSNASIPEIENNPSFAVYPNPSEGIITIERYSNQQYELSIVDLTGKTMVRELNLSGTSSVDLSLLSKGYYIIQITEQSGNVSTKKLIIR